MATPSGRAGTGQQRTQGVVLIVDKARTFTCRSASAKALQEFQSWTTRGIGGGDDEQEQTKAQQHPQQQHAKKRSRRQDDSSFVKMGHAGTLDPMATGCLPVLLGQATKLQDHLPIDMKRYTAELRLGVKTDSDDADGNVVRVDDAFKGVDLNLDLEPVLTKFRGKITQTPPIYSAIHIDGKRAYDLARAGETPVMPTRQIQVYNFSASVIDTTTLKLDVTCGTGTYIRTLGTDLARALGTEGHLRKLRRVSSGPFSVLDERDENSNENVIMRALTLREALESFSTIVDLTGETKTQSDVLTGRSAQLFQHLKGRVARPESEIEVKVTLEWDNALRALMVINFGKETVTSVCHFKEQESMPFVSSMYERRFSSDVEAANEIRVCQFNVLADGLAGKRPDGGGFTGLPRACLDWNFRCKRIIEEISRCQPHIVGLEELDRVEDIQHAFGDRYEIVNKCKPTSLCLHFSNSPDGCLVMFDKSRFQRVNDVDDECFGLGDDSNQVAACVVVKDRLQSDAIYVLCSAHFKATKDDHGEAIRVKQAGVISERLKAIAAKYSASATIVCADLNGVPTGDAYVAMTSSAFKSAMRETSPDGQEPPFTTAKQRGNHQVRHTIDYIFYSNESGEAIKPSRYLEIPPDLDMLPSWRYPSDHFMLCVGFAAPLASRSS